MYLQVSQGLMELLEKLDQEVFLVVQEFEVLMVSENAKDSASLHG